MKQKNVYEYIVTEDKPVKNAAGQIEKMDQKILGQGVVSAYDETNAQLQAALKVDLKDCDVSEVRVITRSFR